MNMFGVLLLLAACGFCWLGGWLHGQRRHLGATIGIGLIGLNLAFHAVLVLRGVYTPAFFAVFPLLLLGTCSNLYRAFRVELRHRFLHFRGIGVHDV